MKNFIVGKYDDLGYLEDVGAQLDADALSASANFKLDKYQFWFTSTINCIPYGGSPVFVIDNVGNTKASGNLLVEKNLTISGNGVFSGNVNINQNLTVAQNIQVGQMARVGGDVYIGGNIFSAQIAAIEAQLAALQSQIQAQAQSAGQ